jgi:hypothetical protein
MIGKGRALGTPSVGSADREEPIRACDDLRLPIPGPDQQGFSKNQQGFKVFFTVLRRRMIAVFGSIRKADLPLNHTQGSARSHEKITL